MNDDTINESKISLNYESNRKLLEQIAKIKEDSEKELKQRL